MVQEASWDTLSNCLNDLWQASELSKLHFDPICLISALTASSTAVPTSLGFWCSAS